MKIELNNFISSIIIKKAGTKKANYIFALFVSSAYYLDCIFSFGDDNQKIISLVSEFLSKKKF